MGGACQTPNFACGMDYTLTGAAHENNDVCCVTTCDLFGICRSAPADEKTDTGAETRDRQCVIFPQFAAIRSSRQRVPRFTLFSFRQGPKYVYQVV